MTETRVSFNGKKKKPAGVFIRLHDSMLNEMQISVLCNPKRSSTENILAIGMPVAGSETGYEATVSHYEAKLAERDTVISRLWTALESIEMRIDTLPTDEEYGSGRFASEMKRQALTIVREEMKALKGQEA